MEYILKTFPVTDEEYAILDEKFGDLANYQAWQLIKKNMKNNHTHEHADIAQDLRMAMVQSASYYKRQVYLEECFSVLTATVKKRQVKKEVELLIKLWLDRTRHGANKQKFGPQQEERLDILIQSEVPADLRPSKAKPLKIDDKFEVYCKSITWNRVKNIGKKITREKSFRTGMVSLSEYDYLVSN